MRLFLLLSSLLVSQFVVAGNTEELLRNEPRFGYRISAGESTENHLKRIVDQMRNRIAKLPRDNNEDYLMLGDTCHWIGHIYEEKRQFREARLWHEMALDAYSRTPIRKSDRIGGGRLDCRSHAKLHLTVLDSGSSLTDVHDQAEHSQRQIGDLMWRVLKTGLIRFGEQTDTSTADYGIAMSCERIVDTIASMEAAVDREFSALSAERQRR